MADKRDLTCIVCPRGCQIQVLFGSDGQISSISGNGCKRGFEYAQNECTHPRRTVTSTVRCADGEVVSVKTSGTVPKELVFDVMAAINSVVAPLVVSIGDVIISDVCSTGVDVVATANKR